MEKAVLIIDPNVSIEYVIFELSRWGYKVLGLATSNYDSSISSSIFDSFRVSANNLEKDKENFEYFVSNYDIRYAFCNEEFSVVYADQLLSRYLPDFANCYKSSNKRYSKYAMQENIKYSGLPSVPMLKLGDCLTKDEKIGHTHDFFDKYKNIVLKPDSNSGGSVGVKNIYNRLQINQYFNDYNKPMFENVDNYLLQGLISGEEYYIDTVSFKGSHIITSIGKYNKSIENGNFLCHYVDIKSAVDPEVKFIVDYVEKLLNIFEIKNGPAHWEVMHDASSDKLFLIELNMRVSGLRGILNLASSKRQGLDQILGIHKLIEGRTTLTEPQKHKKLRLYILKNFIGKYNSVDKDILSKNIKSDYSELFLFNNSSDSVTQNVLDLVGVYLLESSSQDCIDEDTQNISELERQGAFLK
ncbi:ATP-grasp domain-containing protein [Francisella sp. 19X1-34]|uniref:ATP-grasp domain-containing protein n=1 Tax=Francisella sp. 19X1-34 TaxID=3087177 RepID=UPI002E36F665|nr:ATP-grasp domain-containing protein [Francisella sp. 19X1-34]MED7789001.1 ATP-grasp domain-containing protein [Francisella sp. 19X1-34]